MLVLVDPSAVELDPPDGITNGFVFEPLFGPILLDIGCSICFSPSIETVGALEPELKELVLLA